MKSSYLIRSGSIYEAAGGLKWKSLGKGLHKSSYFVLDTPARFNPRSHFTADKVLDGVELELRTGNSSTDKTLGIFKNLAAAKAHAEQMTAGAKHD